MKNKVLTFLLLVSFQGFAADFTCSESQAYPFLKQTYSSDMVYHVRENPKNQVLTLQVTSNVQHLDLTTKELSGVVRDTGESFYAKHLKDNEWVELNPDIITDSSGITHASDPTYFTYDADKGTFNVYVLNGDGGLTLDRECLEVE